ncbi:hypothetical protein PMIN06_001394 [Paraphaeosphaeria minitans]
MTPLLLVLLPTLFAILAAALPSPSDLGPQTATATITFARNTQCFADNTPALHVAAGSGCVAFPADAESLRVVGISEGNSLRYNSLRIYNSNDCSGGWTLEPALTCAGAGGKGCACSRVVGFGSVQLVV